ncbi:MAG: hypothetical protein KL785_06945 [Brevundimonas sp.]|nr:hypothetical protein [Brevundimonas sp.]MBX9460859.1 hypothetical protein [Brevundimonas sp.]
MAKKPKAAGGRVDAALSKAFRAVEAQPAPAMLADHVEQLAIQRPRPDRRS